MITIMGCKMQNDDNILLPSYSKTVVKDSIQYYFSVFQSSYSNQDTLDAFLTIFNTSWLTDTLILPINGVYYSSWSNDKTVKLPICGLAYLGSWTLTNSNGHTVMYGPTSKPQNVMKVPLRPYQTFGGSLIHQAFKDSMSVLLPAGSYTLQENIASISFSIIISLN